MTRGGPGFTSDVIASVIYKQYQAGFFGLSTAGNVILFLVVTAVVLPSVLPEQEAGRRMTLTRTITTAGSDKRSRRENRKPLTWRRSPRSTSSASSR